MKRILINSFLALLSIIIVLFLIEISLRVAGYFYNAPPHKKALVSAKAYNGRFNILCLGDSFTFGFGVLPEESYPAQLQKLLGRENKTIRVYNEGWPGNSSSLLLKKLQEDIDKYCPHSIITVLC